MKSIKIALTLVAVVMCLVTSAQNWPGIRDSLYSKKIGEWRRIQVILPKDYQEDSGRKYEVLYMPDGEWYMEQIPFIYNFVASANFAPQNIFVLIPNTYVNGINIRNRDYSPTKVPYDSLSGGADNYLSFLKDELIPYVENKYPTNGDRTLIGSSFSGLFAIYAFLREPDLFNSFVASDPNLSYGDDFVLDLAAKKLPAFQDVTSTVYFAGLTTSSKQMGSYGMDLVFRDKAPSSLHWKYEEYADETHYSVQHKAFYEGMRFSHRGYSLDPLRVHPMGGMLEKGQRLLTATLTLPPATHFTLDGTAPTESSDLFVDRYPLPGPCVLTLKTLAHRQNDVKDLRIDYAEGTVAPGKQKGETTALKYNLYEGEWKNFPDTRKMKAARAGAVDKDFAIRNLKTPGDAAIVVEGTLHVAEAGYYVFFTNADSPRATIGGHAVFDGSIKGNDVKSYVVPLQKGNHSFRAELLRRKEDPGIFFSINSNTEGHDMWWEHPVWAF